MEIVSVKLISLGASAIVTAHSTYFSIGSVVFDVTFGITVIAYSVAVNGDNIAARNPFTAYIAAACLMDIGSFTARTYAKLFIWRRVQPMPLKYDFCLLKQRAAFHTDQHLSSPSLTLMYRPQ